jgi:hypothetical protein
VVEEIDRHRHNRAVMRLDDGPQARIYPSAQLEIVRPAQEPTPMPASEEVPDAPERWARPLPATIRWSGSPVGRLSTSSHARWPCTTPWASCTSAPPPEQDLARRWLTDPQAAIVVQTWDQAAAVRQAIADEAVPGKAEAPVPVFLIAGAAYQSRMEAERTGEPALAPDRAYVLAGLADRDALAKALSVAMESHLVTPPPSQLVADLQAAHASEIAASLEAADSEVAAGAGTGRDAPAGRSLELAIEAGARQAETQREAERGEAARSDDAGR